MARKRSTNDGVESAKTPQEAPPEVEPPWTIPASWRWTSVKQVGTVRLGRQRSPDTVSARYPTKYLRAANITPNGLDLSDVLDMDFNPVERQTYGLHAGDLVLAEASGSAKHVGRPAIWSDEIPICCFQNTVLRFRPHVVLPDYALLVFQCFALTGAFAVVARGVGIQHLGAAGFAEMQFPLPPLAEQERIGKQANLQLRQTVEARESIESALRRTTRQDDVILETAALGGLVKPTGVAPIVLPSEQKVERQTGLPGQQDPGAAAPNPEFADLMGRSLPRAWRWVRLDQVGEIRLGRQRSPQHEHGEHMIPYLRVANVFEDYIDTSDVRSMNFTPPEQETYRLVPGDILLNEGQSPRLVGRPAIYAGEPRGACYQNTLVRFRHADYVNPQFALLVFRHYLRSGQFTRIARWSTNIAHLGARRLATMPFPLPPRKEQDRIVAEALRRLDASKAQRVTIQSSLQRLEDMRRGIVRSAVSGAIVPQMQNEEPAKALLVRRGPPSDPKPEAKRKERRMPRRAKSSDENKEPLYETIVDLKDDVSPERLFKAAGYDSDSIADVEKFYLALREELGVRVRQHMTEAGVRLEVITHAAT